MFCVLFLASTLTVFAQAPTGVISGTLTDQSGAAIPNATVTVTEKTTGTVRTITTNNAGLYSAAALLAGDYEVRAEAPASGPWCARRLWRPAIPLPSTMQMALGQASEVVNGGGSGRADEFRKPADRRHRRAQHHSGTAHQWPKLSAIWRNLEPGVTVTDGVPAQFNSLINVQTLGGGVGTNGAYTRMTIDGGIINDEWEGNGSTSLNVSQEVVQEFQMTSVNFDASSGIGAGGQVNIVTRSGSNDFHGTGYFFFRDHNMAAYPGLKRATDPTSFNPNCGSNRSEQLASSAKPPRTPSLCAAIPEFGSVARSLRTSFSSTPTTNTKPGAGLSLSSRTCLRWPGSRLFLSARITPLPHHAVRLHYFAQRTPCSRATPMMGTWGSDLTAVRNRCNRAGPATTTGPIKYALGVTTLVTPNVVNDARIFYHWWRSLVEVASDAECPAPCVGQGLISWWQAAPAAPAWSDRALFMPGRATIRRNPGKNALMSSRQPELAKGRAPDQISVSTLNKS